MKLNDIKFFSYLSFFLPAALISGPLISELIILSISFFFIYKVITEKNYIYFDNIFIKLFFLFVIILVFSSFFSNEKIYSLKYSLGYLRYGIFSLSILYLINNFKNYLKYFLFFLFLTLIVLLLDSYFELLFGYNILGQISHSPYIVTSLFGDEIILGSYLVRISPLFLAISILYKINYKKFDLFYFFIIFIFPMIFFSGQRTPFYLSLIFLILTLFLKGTKKHFIVSVIPLILIFSVFNQDKSEYKGDASSYKHRMISDIFFNYKNIESEQKKIIKDYGVFRHMFISPGHNDLWITSIEIFKKNFLLGSGPNTFRKKCEEFKINNSFSCSTHPHNFSFQLISETGLIGFAVYLSLYVALVIEFLKSIFQLKSPSNKNKKININNEFAKLFLIISFLLNFNPLTPNGNFFSNYLNIMMFMPFGFLMFCSNLNKRLK